MQAIQDVSPQAASQPVSSPSRLVIHAGPHTYTFSDSDAPIVIGRELPAQIVIGDDRVSRTHVRIDHTLQGWVAVDQSKNGIYVDGARQSTISIHDGLTINLESP